MCGRHVELIFLLGKPRKERVKQKQSIRPVQNSTIIVNSVGMKVTLQGREVLTAVGRMTPMCIPEDLHKSHSFHGLAMKPCI